MHIKTLRHKGNTIQKLLDYMIDGMENKEEDFLLTHNLLADDMQNMKSIATEFRDNDQYRSNHAKVRWYHEVLSFSPKDREQITEEILADIAKTYIAKRNPKALCFTVAHKEKEHMHLHFCFSGVEYRSPKTLRMDDKTFLELRISMEQYQRENYPELKHSIVYLDKEKQKKQYREQDKNTRKEREYQRERRDKTEGKESEKESITMLVQECFDKATSTQTFYESLEQTGLSLYTYREKTTGIHASRKYRFSTLGITKEQIRTLDRLSSRYQEMEQLRGDRQDYELER